MRHRFAVLFASFRAPAFLGIAGLVALAFGIRAAVHTNAATPLLVVGAVLAVFAFVDWRELNVSHGDTAVRLTRAARDQIESVLERPDIPDDARPGLLEAQANVTAATLLEEKPNRPPEYRAKVRVLGAGRISLTLRTSSLRLLEVVSCDVEHESSGRSWTANAPAQQPLSPVRADLTFPDDFEEESPAENEEGLPTGDYVVTWRTRSGVLPFAATRVAMAEFRLP